tara:strand:+ start:7996 stop:8118 length:123 start_codon:yes stop_codon:yes gene_type:complete
MAPSLEAAGVEGVCEEAGAASSEEAEERDEKIDIIRSIWW